jgi:predicted secreted protein
MRSFFLVSCLAALGLAACSSDSLVLGEAESGSEVLIEGGEQFEVRLDSNPSTGYSWAIGGEAGLTSVALRSRSHEAAETELVGAFGVDVFLFEAVSGAEILRLEYIRPFDQPVVPERTVEYIVRVDDAPWPPDDVSPPATSTATAPIQVGALLGGEWPVDAVVVGYVVWNDDDARLCEVLMESFPPQCGGASVAIANPETLGVEFEQEQSVRWTNDRVQVVGTFDGIQLTLN